MLGESVPDIQGSGNDINVSPRMCMWLGGGGGGGGGGRGGGK